MALDDSLRTAAWKASRAVGRAMRKYGDGLVTDEDDLTGVLVGNLDADMTGEIAGLNWTSSILRHRSGIASEEKQAGADMIIHVSLKTSTHTYNKGVLVQAKRIEPHTNMKQREHQELVEQCNKMLSITPSSFVFDYARGHMRCGPATRISGSKDLVVYNDCIWTPYRFFLELFRSPIGDPRLTSAMVRDLPVPVILELAASDDSSRKMRAKL